MAGICCFLQPNYQSVNHRPILGSVHGVKCFSGSQDKSRTPQFLKFAVSGVTELLRLFSFSSDKDRFDGVSYKQRDELSISGVDDIVTILKSDYDNAYFVTGKELYSRNLRLLVPFFERPSIGLQKIEKGSNCTTNFVLATWKLRTYLKLPWRPLISIDGSTVYELNHDFKIIHHAESWNVSPLEAISQIFTPSD